MGIDASKLKLRTTKSLNEKENINKNNMCRFNTINAPRSGSNKLNEQFYIESINKTQITKGMIYSINNHSYFTHHLVIKYTQIKEIFSSYALIDENQDYYVTYERFNLIISTLFKFDIPILCYTYLSCRVFELLSKKEAFKVYENEFLEGIRILFISNNARSRITCEAMRYSLTTNSMSKNSQLKFDAIPIAADPPLELTFNEIFHFFMLSWKSGFHILYNLLNQHKEELLEKMLFHPEHHQLDYLLKKYENNVKVYLINSFKEYNIDIFNGIPYDIFSKWVLKNHDLEIVFYNKTLKVAVTLTSLNEIGLVYN